jgi:hypothetical protein
MLSLGLGVSSLSCTENAPPQQSPPRERATILSPPVSNNALATSSKTPKTEAKPAPAVTGKPVKNRAPLTASAAPPGGSDSPVPPKGAQYTIFCARIDGDAHVERCNKLKNDLIAKTRMNGWYVIHEERQSLLYYGFYRSFNDPKDPQESARAQADRHRVASITDEMQNRPFQNSLFVDVESPDPVAPREWNLTNAKGYWTLQIAAYKDSPQRKEAAVEAVREARKQGIEAYFFHGETVSSVCIGAWPEEAIRYERPGRQGKFETEQMVVGQPVIVDANKPNAQGPVNQLLPDSAKRNLRVMEGKVEIVDPTLLATMKQYPTHVVNGMTMVKRVEGKEIPDPSLVVKIPHQDEPDPSIASTPGALTPNPILTADPIQTDLPPQATQQQSGQRKPQQPQPQQPGLGKLKSVGG